MKFHLWRLWIRIARLFEESRPAELDVDDFLSVDAARARATNPASDDRDEWVSVWRQRVGSAVGSIAAALRASV
jgi:hypothetical protein